MQPKIEKLYTVSKTKTRADCGSNHEILIAKFRLKLKKVGKTTRLFRYEISQIPYDYTVEEVRDIVQETGIKTIPMEKKCKKAKWLSGEALQIGMKRSEKKRRKGKI